jgi:hypothetical protein
MVRPKRIRRSVVRIAAVAAAIADERKLRSKMRQAGIYPP